MHFLLHYLVLLLLRIEFYQATLSFHTNPQLLYLSPYELPKVSLLLEYLEILSSTTVLHDSDDDELDDDNDNDENPRNDENVTHPQPPPPQNPTTNHNNVTTMSLLYTDMEYAVESFYSIVQPGTYGTR